MVYCILWYEFAWQMLGGACCHLSVAKIAKAVVIVKERNGFSVGFQSTCSFRTL